MKKIKKKGFIQGQYFPKHPNKYKGKVNEIIYRSSYELQFMNYCDNRSYVVAWSSEEVVIPYVKPTDGKIHRYFMDFWMEYISNEYEYEDNHWVKVDMDKVNDESKQNLELIIKNKHPHIIAIRSISKIPNNAIGKVNDVYISDNTHNIFIKIQGKIKTDDNGNKIHATKRVLIEIKPYNQTIKPKKQQRITEQYRKKIMTFAINTAKWNTAEEYAKKNNMEFQIITEKWLRNAK